MEQHGTNCFSGFPVRFEDVAEAQLERQANIRLKYMVGTSMGLTERTRLLGMKAFAARTFSAYTSKEAHKIAHECPVSGGFHVNCELLLVEILDAAGNPCSPGVTGRVIVTPFLGTAQPIIRYEQGDLATWGTRCSCGRSLPIISRIDGRIRNQFQFAGGRRFMPYLGYAHYRDLLKADRWQVAQTGPLDIEVRYISPQPDQAIDFAALTQIYRSAFHKDLRVSYHRVTAMPLTPAGKFIDYVNEYQAG
jgi:phenylacetate-CoA ligase